MNKKPTHTPTDDVFIMDFAPTADTVTPEDRALFQVYLCILDRVEDGDLWQTIAREVLQADPIANPEQAKRRYDSYLARAQWMTKEGAQQISSGDPATDFRNWVRSLLKHTIDQGKIVKPDVPNFDEWAHEKIDQLITREILVPDPNLSQEDCQEILKRHFTD